MHITKARSLFTRGVSNAVRLERSLLTPTLHRCEWLHNMQGMIEYRISATPERVFGVTCIAESFTPVVLTI